MHKKHVRCTKCSSLATKRNGTRTNKTGTIQRFSCTACGTSFTLRPIPYQQVSPAEQLDLTRKHLECRTPIRQLVRDTGRSSATVVEAIHAVTSQCATAAWIANRLKPNWGGYLAIDGKVIRVWDWAAKHFRYTKAQRRWLHKMTLLLCLDLQTLDLPMHHLGEEEATIDLVLMLRELKALDYPLKGFVTDGNMDIAKAVSLVFGSGIPHQLCVVHFLRNLRAKVRQGQVLESQYREARKKLLRGERPAGIAVPDELFTYQSCPGLPRTNQALEVCIRGLSLRLKTIGQFGSWQHAASYCNALVARRRFTRFTDRKGKENGKAPLELAGCRIAGLSYLSREQESNRKLKR